MHCREAAQKLQLYLDNRLTIEQARTLEVHVANCASCLEELPAGFRGDGVAGRDRDSRVHHLGDARALPSEEIAHAGVPFGFPVAEEVHPAPPGAGAFDAPLGRDTRAGAHRPTRSSSSAGTISPAGSPA